MDEEQFKKGIEEFNSRLFFECHDTLEDLWHGTRGEDRLFLQGLIQVSVGFYHILNRNYKGALSQWTKAEQKLAPYCPVYREINLARLLEELARWRTRAEEGLNNNHGELVESEIPRLSL